MGRSGRHIKLNNKKAALRGKKDVPSSLSADGVLTHHRGNNIHRDGGAAVIHPDGTREWWEDGVWLRTERRDEQGLYHSDDEPSIEYAHPFKMNEYHRRGVLWKRSMDLKYIEQTVKQEGPPTSFDNPVVVVEEFIDEQGALHLENGPARTRYRSALMPSHHPEYHVALEHTSDYSPRYDEDYFEHGVQTRRIERSIDTEGNIDNTWEWEYKNGLPDKIYLLGESGSRKLVWDDAIEDRRSAKQKLNKNRSELNRWVGKRGPNASDLERLREQDRRKTAEDACVAPELPSHSDTTSGIY
jgi:hypothetical protein